MSTKVRQPVKVKDIHGRLTVKLVYKNIRKRKRTGKEAALTVSTVLCHIKQLDAMFTRFRHLILIGIPFVRFMNYWKLVNQICC